MRRRTPGVIASTEFIPRRIFEAERHDPARVVRLLEPLVLERRRNRLLEVIGARLASVQVLFDAPHDPHNGAAVMRTCEAFGVQFLNVVERQELFLAAPSVSRGSEKWVDVRRFPDVTSAAAHLRGKHGMELVAAHPEGELSPHDLAELPRLALVLGNERDGIAEELSRACTRRVRVPMRGFVESLNVSVSAAVLLSHATRGRAGDLSEEDRLRMYARGLYFTVVKADAILSADEVNASL